MSQGKLEKFTIRAYKDKKGNSMVGDPFKLPINPEGYTETFKIHKDKSQKKGSGGNDPKFSATKSEVLKLDFYFDNTGTVENNHLDGTPIPKQVNTFLKTVYYIEGEKHDPLFVKISWGADSMTRKNFAFMGLLEDLSIEYKLFKPSGEPLRAKLSASFISYNSPQKQELFDDKGSPDLTKVRKVGENDRLPLLTYDLYGDSKYYWQIAEANNLTTFRKLNTGQNLVFPSIKKDSE